MPRQIVTPVFVRPENGGSANKCYEPSPSVDQENMLVKVELLKRLTV